MNENFKDYLPCRPPWRVDEHDMGTLARTSHQLGTHCEPYRPKG